MAEEPPGAMQRDGDRKGDVTVRKKDGHRESEREREEEEKVQRRRR